MAFSPVGRVPRGSYLETSNSPGTHSRKVTFILRRAFAAASLLECETRTSPLPLGRLPMSCSGFQNRPRPKPWLCLWWRFLTPSPVPGQQQETESPGAHVPRPPLPSPLSATPGPSPAEQEGAECPPSSDYLWNHQPALGWLLSFFLSPPSAPWRGILLLTRE